MDYIAFPGLGIDKLDINRAAFSVFGKEIYWYGILITLGILLALVFAIWQFKKYGMTADDALDILLFGAPTAIVFARLYYIIFSPGQFNSFMDAIAIWNGGLAIYGAVIGAVLAGFLVCKFKKLNIGLVFDIGCMGLLIGQTVGRWGNFINREAYGTITNLPWRMEILDTVTNSITFGQRVSVHPTFLYESLWNALGLVLLFIYLKKLKKFDGEVFFGYLVWYGLGRFFIEGMRTDSLMLGNFRVSQLLALITMFVGIILIVYFRMKTPSHVEETATDEIIDEIPDAETDISKESTGEIPEVALMGETPNDTPNEIPNEIPEGTTDVPTEGNLPNVPPEEDSTEDKEG